jgi:predicted phosphodiesterase
MSETTMRDTTMRIGVITDVHVAPAGTAPISWHSELLLESAGERYSAALELLDRERPDVVVVLGDLTHLGDAPSMTEFVQRSAASRAPVRAVEGNHDVVPQTGVLRAALSDLAPGADVAMADAAGERLVGMSVHGIDVAHVGPGELYGAVGELPRVAGPSIVLSHFPVLSLQAECTRAGLRYAGDLVNRADVEHAVTQSNVPTIVLAGHIHVRHAIWQGSVLQLSFGALVEAPFDVTMVELESDGERMSVQRRALGPAGAWPAAISERDARFAHRGDAWVREG